jgi:hypothetical protein
MTKIITLLVLMVTAKMVRAEIAVDTPIGGGKAVEVTDVPQPKDENPQPAPVKKALHNSNAPAEPDKTVHDGKGDDGKGDTYNFYFQKGSGPGSVEQGRDQQRVQPPAEKDKDDARTVPPRKKEESYTVPAIELETGLLVSPSSSGSGSELGAQWNATPSFGLQVQLYSLRFSNSEIDSSIDENGINDGQTSTSGSGGSFGLVYTPLTFNASLLPVRISGLAGVMLLNLTTDRTYSYVGSEGIQDGTSSDKTSKFLAYGGIAATASITKHFGVIGYAKITSDPKFSQIGVSAAWLL